MGTLDKMMSKAYNIKEDVYGEKPGYFIPRDIHPHIKGWIASLILTIITCFIVDNWIHAIMVGAIWLLTQWSFWRAKVLP